MADLSIIYSKTPRGLRARASLVGGLSSHLMKVLSHVDGTLKAENILLKFDHLTPEVLMLELAQLEKEGYIKVSGNTRPNQEWSPTVHFTPMVVEEYQSEEELEAIARAKAEQEAKLAADRKANAEAAAQREIERKAQEEKALIQARSKAKAEAKMKEFLEAEAKETALKEAERLAKETEELRLKSELVAKAKEEENAKLAQEQQQLAANKAREEAQQAQAKAEAEAKEIALYEAERMAKEELRLKAELEAKAKEEEKIKLAQEQQQIAAIKAREEAEQAQAKADAEAKEAALKEAERLAKEAEELRLKSELEAQKREEANRLADEVKLKAEEVKQAKLKEKEKEKAHLEIERVLKEAEEKRKKSAKKAKEEKLEAKRKVKAEEERIKAERKSKEEISLLRTTLVAEEKADAEEIEAHRITIEQIANEAEEKRKSSKETLRKKEEAETAIEETRIKERLEEEEREKAATKEKTRLEMERIAKEADAVRKPATILKFAKPKKDKQESPEITVPNTESLALAKMEERARKEAERLAKEAEELAEIEAEEKAQKKTKGFAKAVVKPEKSDAIEEVKEIKPEKKEKPTKQISRNAYQFKIPTKFLKRCLSGIAKLIFVYLPFTLVLLIGIAHFINLKMLAEPIENLISESVQDAVTIQEVRVSLFPEPHFVLGNVIIGQNTGLSIGTIYVVPNRDSLFEDVKLVQSAVIEDMQLNHEGFRQSLGWIHSLGAAKRLKVGHINLKNLTLNIRDLQLGIFDGELNFSDSKMSASKMLKSIDLMSADHTLKINVLNTNGTNNLILNANNWTLPLEPKLLITKLNARGTANQESINFEHMDGELYGGVIRSKANFNWASGWQASGGMEMNGINASQFLASLNSPTLVEGKLTLTGSFYSKTSQSSKLYDKADTNADFVINHGSISGVELTRAVIAHGSQTLMGEDTHFDKLTGSLQVKNGVHQYRKVFLQSPQFRASAYFDVMPNQILSGKVSANLQAQSRNLQANFVLEGTSNNVRSR